MVGGERERKGKRTLDPGRMRDPKRPKPPKAVLRAATERRDGLTILSESTSAFVLCPFYGAKLKGKDKKCPTCLKRWGQKFITEGGPAPYAVLVDARHYGLEWRKKFYWRLTSTEHSQVLWTALAPIHLKTFLANFSEDWDEDAFATAAVTEHVKLLETTKAVEEFCQFAGVNQEKGLGAAKLLPTGEISMVVPPLYATHVGSEKAGDEVEFEFSWVSMNVHGEINEAEHTPEPQEGWEHVEARVRDHAVNMKTCRLKVSEDMVKASEAKLLAKYENEDAFALARKQ
jgi:hypothetical protein